MSEPSNDQQPPVFGNWKGWYWLVLLVMAAQVLVYLFITQSFI
jgi:hypothetical protein